MKIDFGRKQKELINLYKGLADNCIINNRTFTDEDLCVFIENQIEEFQGLDNDKKQVLHTALQEHCLGNAHNYSTALNDVIIYQKRELAERSKFKGYGFESEDELAKIKALDVFLKDQEKKRNAFLKKQKETNEKVNIRDINKYFNNQPEFYFSKFFRKVNSVDTLFSDNQFSVYEFPNKLATMASKFLYIARISDSYLETIKDHKERTVIPAARRRLRKHCLGLFKTHDFSEDRINRQLEQTFKYIGLTDKKEVSAVRKQLKDDCFDTLMLETASLLLNNSKKLNQGNIKSKLNLQMKMLDNYKTTFRKDFTIEQLQRIEQLERVYVDGAVNGADYIENKKRHKQLKKSRRKL